MINYSWEKILRYVKKTHDIYFWHRIGSVCHQSMNLKQQTIYPSLFILLLL